MKRDFTQQTQDYLKTLVREANDTWDDFPDELGDSCLSMLDSLGLLKAIQEVQEYQRSVFDMNNTSLADLQEIFDAVYELDARYAVQFNRQAERLREVHEKFRLKAGFLEDGYDYDNPSIFLRDSEVPERVFGSQGAYGGKQDAAARWPDYMTPVIRKYFPNMTMFEVKQMLGQLKSDGGEYIALGNTLLQHYEGRADEFEKTFGFPLMWLVAHNHEMLTVDFMASTMHDFGVTPDQGSSQGQRELHWERYLSHYGVEVDVVPMNGVVTAENYTFLLREGSIIISTQPVRLYDEAGTLVHDLKTSQTMTVTGATEDGRLSVSLWGEKYFVDPGEFSAGDPTSFIQFEQIRYKD